MKTIRKLPDMRTCSNSTGCDVAFGLFFCLTGALLATSVVNLGNSGVPIFFLTFLVPFIFPVLSGFRKKRGVGITSRSPIFLGLFFTTITLCVVTAAHIATDVQPFSFEAPHFIVRVSFLLYCWICISYLQGDVLVACLFWLRRILTFLAFYGIYQVPAKILGLPLFLDWLRNNKSFDVYQYDTAGWINIVRATSIYPEPSLCIVPVVVLILLNVYLPASKLSRRTVWVITLAFTLLTFSRTIWLSIIAMTIGGFLARFEFIKRQFQEHRLRISAVFLILVLVMPIWSLAGSNYKADLSKQERAGSVIVGMHFVIQHPIWGAGWNSYEYLMPSYESGVPDVDSEVQFSTIHNMFVSYAEQAGVGGFLFAIFPFFLMLFARGAPLGLRLSSVCSLLVAAEFGGDVAYVSLFWLWVAILLNWKSIP